MRVLMVTMQFPVGPGQSYLTTELADAMLAAGHEVEVLHLDWRGEPGGSTEQLTSASGVRVVRCAPRLMSGLGAMAAGASKFMLSGRHVAQVAQRHFRLDRFDAMIAWMPAVGIAPLLPLVRRAGVRHRLLFIWDFFPEHHHEIGRLPGGPPLWIARAWERQLLGEFTAILCTLPGNADYLRRHYPVRDGQQVLVTPIWADITPRARPDRGEVRERHGLPADVPIALFGGQLVAGRGFEQMLAAADEALKAGSPMRFLFVGDGPFAATIRERATRQANILHRPAMTRDAYLDAVAACDVGMVATVPGVTSYSIPSKTVDYLRGGIPVVAAVEHGSEFASMLEKYGVGQSVAFGDGAGFFQSAQHLATDPGVQAAIGAAARRCLEDVFDVRHAVSAVAAATR